MRKAKSITRDMWCIVKRYKIYMIIILKGEEREWSRSKEVMVEKFSNCFLKKSTWAFKDD